MPEEPVPPVTPKRPSRSEWFGRAFIDDYAWIRQPDWFNELHQPERLDPEIRDHLQAENAYCDAVLTSTNELQAVLFDEMMRRSAGGGDTPARVDGPWAYSSRIESGAKYPRLVREPVDGGPEQLLLDAEAEAEGKSYYRLSEFTLAHPSPDQRLFAWAADEAGDQHFRLYVKDIATQALASSVIESCYGEFAFSPDSRWLYWVWRDPVSRPTKVFRRPAMGGEDVLIYEETDPGFFIALERLSSNAYVSIRVFNGETSEVWLIPASNPAAAPALVEPRRAGVFYELEHWNDRFVVRTNADGATDYKLMTADPAAPGAAGWREWVAHRPGRFIAQVRAFRDHLVRLEWVDANPTLIVSPANGGPDQALVEAEPAYDLTLGDQAYDTAILRYTYQSPATPPRWIDYDMASGERTVVQEPEIEEFDAGLYEVRRLFAPASDGESIPITVLMRRGTRLDGHAPLYLYAYGSYGYSVTPEFSAPNLSLVDRGWIAAIAHIRGGGEKGPGWYRQAQSTGKKVSITDFIASAEHLIAEGYTGAGRIVSHSLSAGGIVIGGSVNLRPELWAGVINQVPFVDVLNSVHDTKNPLIPAAYAVWGDPADPAVFDYIASYSPYENIRPGPYPAALAIGGLLDNRVGYWESAKWVARLREMSTSGRPMLLRINMTAGHQGHAGLSDQLRQAAFFRAFAIWAAQPQEVWAPEASLAS